MNYETNKIIFVCYPPGAGGKFLINCLGVSNHAVLQHQDLIHYTQEQKKTFLINKIKENDLILGIPSNGIHSNGFSLVRAILKINKINII